MKKCRVCEIEKDISEYRKRGGKCTKATYTLCKDCQRIENSLYHKKPSSKKRHNELQKEYNKKNPLALKKRTKTYWDKNKNKRSEVKKLRYKTDEEYRKKRCSMINEKRKDNRAKLTDLCVVGIIRKQADYRVTKDDISNDLIELKRNAIKLKREIKNKQQ